MHFLSLIPAALLALTLPASAAPDSLSSRLLSRQSTVPLPADDPFYDAPAGFEKEAPGSILRNRTIQPAHFSFVPYPVSAWQLLYRTTAINGSAITTVATIFQPRNAQKNRFVSYATAYDAASTKCDPSYAYQLGADTSDNAATDAERLIIEGFLTQGYTVSSSDYEGPDAAFAAGRLEGMALLDSLRAVSSFSDTLGFTTDKPDIVGIGNSGGAIATGWAATLQKSYARDLPIKGWVHGGTPVNLTSVILYDANRTYSGFLFDAIAGLTKPSAYGAELGPVLDEILTEKGKEALQFANENCASSDISEYPFKSILSYEFQKLGPRLLEEPTIKEVLKETLMGATEDLTPVAPTLILHAVQDEIIPYSDALALVKRYCDRKADVTFITFKLGGHLSEGIRGFPDSYRYVNDAFAGKVDKGCYSKTELNSPLDPEGLIAELEPIFARLQDILGKLASSSD